jgi:hypothetical protein
MQPFGRRLAASVASFVALAVALVVALAGAAFVPGAPLAETCAGAGPNHAALVVEHGDGSVVTRCVAFDSATITGEQLLDSSGVAWSGQTFGGFGRAVCALDGEPAHYATCPGTDGYWAIFHSAGSGGWQLSAVGISSLKLAGGDAEGFHYVPTSGDPLQPPTAAGVCDAGSSGAPGQPSGASAAGTLRASDAPAGGAEAPASPRSPGFDTGLLAAGLVGLALGGLALIRLLAARRRVT